MIEKAARAAMMAEGRFRCQEGHPWDVMLGDMEKRRYLGMTRAVLQAIREPSEGMLEGFGIHKSRARRNWQAMIDAALSEEGNVG